MLLKQQIRFPTKQTIKRKSFKCKAQDPNKLYNILKEQHQTKTLVAQIAPAIRVAIGESYGLKASDVSPNQLVTALRNIGFDYVFDTLFAADVTIVEEGNELLHKLQSGELNNTPMFTSCCPGWIGLVEKSYPEILPFISTTKSPQMIMGAVVKHVFAKSIHLKPEDIYMVSIMPCVRKQGEADREEFSHDVDLVITTNELLAILKDREIDVTQQQKTEFDKPFGVGSGGAAIFGKSGGVMTAALRYAYFVLTGKVLENIDFTTMEDIPDVREASLTFTPSPDNIVNFPSNKPLTIKVAIVAGLGGAKKFLKLVADGKVEHKFVEIMACAPFGCIGGAGNPSVGKNKHLLNERKEALISFDASNVKKAAQDNEDVNELYKLFDERQAHDLFHTHFHAKE